MRLTIGLVAVFALFQWSAQRLGSDRGQAGLLVGALVVCATLAVERVAFGQPIRTAARTLGLGRPRAMGMIAAGAIGISLLLLLTLTLLSSGRPFGFVDRWLLLIPGLFAQAGIAEETLFRGYLFGRLRIGRSFWSAAAVSMLPFVAVHLILFASMPWPLALAALTLSVVMSFPFARLFELGGRTIWAPALVHFVVQGAMKVLVLTDDVAAWLPLAWIAASAVLPMGVFLIPVGARDSGLGVRYRDP